MLSLPTLISVLFLHRQIHRQTRGQTDKPKERQCYRKILDNYIVIIQRVSRLKHYKRQTTL